MKKQNKHAHVDVDVDVDVNIDMGVFILFFHPPVMATESFWHFFCGRFAAAKKMLRRPAYTFVSCIFLGATAPKKNEKKNGYGRSAKSCPR